MSHQLVTNDIRTYIILKQRETALQKELKNIKESLEPYENKIIQFINTDNKPLEINKQFRISIQENLPFEPITFKYLEKCFKEIIPDVQQQKHLIKYIKDNRARIYKQKIAFENLNLLND